MKYRVRLGLIAALIFIGSGVIPAGCTYDRVQLSGGKAFSIERVESSPIYVSWVYAEEENNELIISGLLRSHFTYTQGTGHVDVAVISPGGELLSQTSVDYAPKTILPRSGKHLHFQAHFPFIPPDGSRIRVALHHSPMLEMENSDCGDNLAAKENAI